MDKILVVEDEANIREFVVLNLKMSSFACVEAENSDQVFEALAREPFDLALLDVNIPGKSGMEICKHIKEHHPDTAVIMVTAKGLDMDKIMGLEYGADDYVTKPFNPMELIARIRSVLRRSKRPISQPSTNVIKAGDLVIDFSCHQVTLVEKEVKLTPKEYELLVLLAKNSNAAFTRDELLNMVWGKDFFGEVKTVDVHVRRLREKIEKDPKNPRYIETVWGHGYRWRG